jgi:putative addiction module component (TIGR02574 family)
MSDLRQQIENLSASEKAELLDAVWESLEADAPSLTDAQRAELDHRIERHEQNPPMSSPRNKSGRAYSKNLDAAGRLDTRIRLPGDYDGGAGTAQFGQIAVSGHANPQRWALPANDRTVRVRL